MRILNDIAYADNYNNEQLKIVEIKNISELCMLVMFSNYEKRIFDLSDIVKRYPVYSELKNFEIFKNAYIENGVIVWNNGKLDISVETVYKNSFEYEQNIAI